MLKTKTNYSVFVFLCLSITISCATAKNGEKQINPTFTSYLDYAKLAQVAYESEAKIKQSLSKTQYTLTKFNTLPIGKVSYFLATDEKNKHQILSVRGTANLENALVDMAISLKPEPKTNILLHDGFAQSALGIYEDVKPQLKKDFTIDTTGHSLGGAVAVILAMLLDKDAYSLKQTITFGQPKVTNIAGAKEFSHLKITRVVSPKDVVPLVPPVDPTDLDNVDIFWHLGTEVILYEGQDYAKLTGIKSMLRATKILTSKPSEENLEEHKMTNYVSRLDLKTAVATEIEYKQKFSIFGGMFSSD